MRGAGVGRSESMRSAMPKRAMDGSLPVISKSKSRDDGHWTSDDDDESVSGGVGGGSGSHLHHRPSAVALFCEAATDPRRGSLPPSALGWSSPVRDRSLDRVARLEAQLAKIEAIQSEGGLREGGAVAPGACGGARGACCMTLGGQL